MTAEPYSMHWSGGFVKVHHETATDVIESDCACPDRCMAAPHWSSCERDGGGWIVRKRWMRVVQP